MQVFFLSRFEYTLTCSFKRHCLVFLGTTALIPVPVFSRTSMRGDSADLLRYLDRFNISVLLVQCSVQDGITSSEFTRTDSLTP